MRLVLRPKQAVATDGIRRKFSEGFRAPLLVGPCAFGKTTIFAHITEGAAAKGNRVMILVHTRELVGQCSDELDMLGVQHGIISPEYKHTTDAVQVASVQTLVRRLDREPPPALIIADEAHHAVAGTWTKIFVAYPKAKILGVSASPIRTDGRGLGDVFDTMVMGPSVKELIADGHLSKPIVYAPPTNVDISSIQHRAGEFDAAASAALLDKASIVGDVISHYRKLCDGKPAIAFCATVAHAHHTAEAFRAAGFNSAAIEGTTEVAERKQMVRELGNGGLNVLTSVNVVSEGFNCPVVFASILLRPTESLGLFIQQTGRAMRAYPGKTHACIIDHVGSVFRHDMPDADRIWTLDATKKKKVSADDEKIQRMKMCVGGNGQPGCYAMNPLWRTKCEQCSAIFEPQRELPKQVDGELVEVTEAQKQAMRVQSKREVGGARTREQLLAIAKARGYKSGWADFILRARGQRDGTVSA